MTRATLACLAVLAALAVGASGHGWMMEPVPRGGGGTGSGNASTRRPCGKDGPTEVTAEVVAGRPFEVTYRRANNHGASGNNVDLVMSYSAAGKAQPEAADFDAETSADAVVVGAGLMMRVDTRDPQTQQVTAPDRVGPAVLQFKWQPRNSQGQNAGGAWYDCAYVEVVAGVDPACAENNPCDENASCSGETEAVCECGVGFFGNGRTCTELPDDEQVELLVLAHEEDVKQDEFTLRMAEILAVDEGRILFDRTSEFNVTDLDTNTTETQTVVYFSIGADPETGAADKGGELARMVARRSGSLDALGHPVAAVKVDGEVTSAGSGGGFPTGTSSGTIFGAAFGTTTAVVLLAAGGFVFWRRRQEDAKVARPSYVPDYHQTAPASGAGGTEAGHGVPVAAAGAASSSTASLGGGDDAAAGVGAPPGGAWQQYATDDGTPYWYNASTGESRWEDPAAAAGQQ